MSDQALHQDLVARGPGDPPKVVAPLSAKDEADMARAKGLRASRRLLLDLFVPGDFENPLRLRILAAFATLVDRAPVAGATKLRTDIGAMIGLVPHDTILRLGRPLADYHSAADEVTNG